MITDAKDLNFFENIELDKDDFFLNCKNCVLDLSGDQPKALEHNADLLLSKICNASYNPVATCTLWEKTVNEIMQGDSSKIEYLQKMSGRFLTGDTSEEEFYIFFGATTRNGKSTITELLLYLLGDYATTISPESLAINTCSSFTWKLTFSIFFFQSQVIRYSPNRYQILYLLEIAQQSSLSNSFNKSLALSRAFNVFSPLFSKVRINFRISIVSPAAGR